MTTIIGIAGVTGAGKTTLVKELGKTLNATTIHWDDFDHLSKWPANYVEWYYKSKDYSAWEYPDLAETLKTLKAGNSLVCPATKRKLVPTAQVIFDAPLGHRHKQTGQYIDFLVWIEVPPDISLARRLLREYRNKPKASTTDIVRDLDYYINHSRPTFVDNKEALAEANLVVAGTFPTSVLAQSVIKHLPR